MNEERRENGQRGCGGGAGILYYNMRRGTIMISTMLHVDQGAAVGLSQELRMYSEATGGRVAKRASTLFRRTSVEDDYFTRKVLCPGHVPTFGWPWLDCAAAVIFGRSA